MTVKEEQEPVPELPLEDEAEAWAGAEFFSPPLSSGEEAAEDDDDDETDSEGNGGARNGAPPLRKGPWTPDEDKRLRDYVQAHGEGNWNQVQRNAGLNRCGKSCRLRWANHLRPDLKKGPFDAEEEDKIIRFHMEWGNKWARMAAQLPGRTDNEIKNYWNTRMKRNQRSNLPLYPPEYSLSRVPDQDMNCHTPDESRGKKRSNELLQEKEVGVVDLVGGLIVFEHLKYDMDPVVPIPLKRHASTSDLSSVQNSDKMEQTLYSNDLNYVLIKSQSVPLGNAIASGYDGSPSTSGIMHWSMNTELPSFQMPGSDAFFTIDKCYPDPSFSDAGMPVVNDESLCSQDLSYLYQSNSLLCENPWEEPKPLTDAGQWLDPSAWKSVSGARTMPDFPGP